LSKFILRKIVNGKRKDEQPLTVLKDLLFYDVPIYNSLKYLLESEDVDWEVEDFRFSIINDEGEEKELIKHGKDTRVNN